MVVTNIEVWTYLLRVYRERPPTLAIRAVTDLHLPCRVLVERTEDSPALAAIKFDVLQLGKDTSATSNNSSNADKLVQIGPAKLTERGGRRKVSDADMHL